MTDPMTGPDAATGQMAEKRGDWRDACGVLAPYFPEGVRSETLLAASRLGMDLTDRDALLELQRERDEALAGSGGAER